ncbi:RHS repeat domain-containing protein [Flavivirga sp. 57AJ16]|uniref:RHS repeat domain-containing protein n=1 Tax=Flavivirga sp. 57AJ16 TaxID=3025307 RepID=UPI0023663959|nr:RHS repeat-associated core domain-containing protein [Flavivirga sp. 57AJ16]MDD7886035.1 RHS repeat-associated core domain-containing protein [Flavivirga sp. 57AJ16]
MKNILTSLMLLLTFGLFAQEDMNWVITKTFDINGNVTSNTKSYFDELGKGLQTQSIDLKTGKTWATQTLNDAKGRPALQSLSAPIRSDGTFLYSSGFIKKTNGNPYTNSDFESNPEDPEKIGNQTNSLGWYYSENNTNESYQDVTDYPFVRTIYSKLNPGSTLKAIGGNKINVNGQEQWLNGFTYTMPAAQEMYYVFGKGYFGTPDTVEPSEEVITKFYKTVNIDVHGVESVSFSDGEGKLLAVARSGGNVKYEVVSVIGKQGFVDIHIPQGIVNSDIQFLGNSSNYKVFDLRTEEMVSTSQMTGGHFYRVEYLAAIENTQSFISSSGLITTPGNTKGIRYKVNYYNYALNYYDKVGRLSETTQYKGFDTASFNLTTENPNHQLKSVYKYNALDQITEVTDPDEGHVEFIYREDGQIRYSQDSEQALNNEFSYTNYDEYERPVENGVYEGALSSVSVTTVLDVNNCKDRYITVYDNPQDPNGDPELIAALNAASISTSNYPKQNFVAGNISKTYTRTPTTTTSWYSYDIHGRIEWMVQDIEGLGTKTIDYEYDPIKGVVTKVIYQKHVPSELFAHQYIYNNVGEIIEVKTSTNNSSFTTQATYEYTEIGELKRTILGNNLQGIDYVYNLQGQLKAINHPSLNSAKDPGGDTNDVFGMHIDYYNGDYNRANTPKPITTSTQGINRYDGRIKATRWAIKGVDPTPNTLQNAYAYTYNNDKWLSKADYGTYSPIVETNAEEHETSTAVTTSSNSLNIEATGSITLQPGFHAQNGSNFTAKIINPGGYNTNTTDYDVDNITYDANGNLLTLIRNKNTESGNNAMDNFTYHYNGSTNQLNHVSDAAGNANVGDLASQSNNNYEYNSIGQLVKNVQDDIEYFYNDSGLVTKIEKGGQPYLNLYYDDKGQRIRKEVTNDNGLNWFDTYYVRDLSGDVLAIYEGAHGTTHNVALSAKEYPVYGVSRLGVYNKTTGATSYEVTDHLGNVRAVVTGSSNTYSDYYPFGMPMPFRNIAADYRYAFQGQELDGETGKEAFQLRLWDGRIGRWLSTDPYGQFASPYLGMGNNPITNIDPDGGMSIGPDDPPVDLDPVYLFYSKSRKSFDFSGMRTFQQVSTDWWQSSFDGTLKEYNNMYSTNFTGDNALNQWAYQFYYKPQYDDMISSMHAATGQAAEIILETAMAIAPVPKLGLLKHGLKLLRTTKVIKTANTGVKLLTQGVRSFKPGSALTHFNKHGSSVMKALGEKIYTLTKYIDDANHVINTGTFVPQLNGYIRLIGGKGSAKYAFVGVDRATGAITSFHLKTVKELAKKAPNMFGY